MEKWNAKHKYNVHLTFVHFKANPHTSLHFTSTEISRAQQLTLSPFEHHPYPTKKYNLQLLGFALLPIRLHLLIEKTKTR